MNTLFYDFYFFNLVINHFVFFFLFFDFIKPFMNTSESFRVFNINRHFVPEQATLGHTTSSPLFSFFFPGVKKSRFTFKCCTLFRESWLRLSIVFVISISIFVYLNYNVRSVGHKGIFL